MHITLSEFNTLTTEDQALLVWLDGIFLDQYFDAMFNILLYKVEDYYVEVFYHLERKVVYGYRSFDSIDQLAPYLNKINIDHLIAA